MLCSHLTSAFVSTSLFHGDANAKAENGPGPILCVNVCVAIDIMLKFDGDAHAEVSTGLYLAGLASVPSVNEKPVMIIECISTLTIVFNTKFMV